MPFASALREVPGAGLEPACPQGHRLRCPLRGDAGFARGSVRVVTHDIRVRSPRGAGGGTRTRMPPKGAPDFKLCPETHEGALFGTSPYVSIRLRTSPYVALWHSNGTGHGGAARFRRAASCSKGVRASNPHVVPMVSRRIQTVLASRCRSRE